MQNFNFPLMADNITAEDINTVIAFLKKMPRLTQSENVYKFEEEWSNWLGVKHSVYVNSGASANLLTIAALKYLKGEGGEIIVSPLNWVSDITACIHNGFTPVFVDINPYNLAMNDEKIIAKLNKNTKAVILTHIQGFNGLTDKLLYELKRRNIPLIEDVCEAHGATHKGKKCGSFGWASNFSFYFAHHMSTIEGGMISTNDSMLYEICRMLRSHGMTRECMDDSLKRKYIIDNPELNPEFIFAYSAYNCRGTEIGGLLGRSQLKRLDENNEKRKQNWNIFLNFIDCDKYRTDFLSEGSCNYAFALIMRKQD
ncbi:MAG TPA: DegT/DnrJ/EryC1/StrS aminotransferase family protein, partial [Victivallales bacterium]|nr:DegT/DnrJ/EryC1/StrS aminotransferase family protein [Victivallales bacterium]